MSNNYLKNKTSRKNERPKVEMIQKKSNKTGKQLRTWKMRQYFMGYNYNIQYLLKHKEELLEKYSLLLSNTKPVLRTNWFSTIQHSQKKTKQMEFLEVFIDSTNYSNGLWDLLLASSACKDNEELAFKICHGAYVMIRDFCKSENLLPNGTTSYQVVLDICTKQIKGLSTQEKETLMTNLIGTFKQKSSISLPTDTKKALQFILIVLMERQLQTILRTFKITDLLAFMEALNLSNPSS